MDYSINLMHENDETAVYRTSSGLWLSCSKKDGGLSFVTEERAVEIVHEHTGDIGKTCKVLNGDYAKGDRETPQLIALLLSQIEPQKAAEILVTMPDDIKSDLGIRIALLENASPVEALFKVAEMESVHPEQLLEYRGAFEGAIDGDINPPYPVTGMDKIVSILECLDMTTRTEILKSMYNESKQLAKTISENVLTFEDLITFEDRAIQMVLKEVDIKELTIALKAASAELKEKIFGNISNRVKEMIQEEMDFAGPMRLTIVKESQRRIVEIIRRLQQEQQIVIVSGVGDTDDDIYV